MSIFVSDCEVDLDLQEKINRLRFISHTADFSDSCS